MSLIHSNPKHKNSRDRNFQSPFWTDDKIPPLISIGKEKDPNDKISIQSLNQSEVRSIYTVDREQTDKHTLDIINHVFKFQRQQPEKFNTKHTNQEISENTYETPVNRKVFQNQVKSQNILSSFANENEHQYKNCNAIKLYRQIVQQPSKNISKDMRFQFDWMINKSPSELLANIMTNKSRINLYIHYLLNEIYLNQKNNTLNQLHQELIFQYNPTLKEVYASIICLLIKILNYKNSQNNSPVKQFGLSPPIKSQIEVSLFQNGISIDLDPKLTQVKKQNNDRIRKLKQSAESQEIHLQDIKKIYEEIIQNYTTTIENMNKNNEYNGNDQGQLLNSIVRIDMEPEQEEDVIRKKNHTFGMPRLGNFKEQSLYYK